MTSQVRHLRDCVVTAREIVENETLMKLIPPPADPSVRGRLLLTSAVSCSCEGWVEEHTYSYRQHACAPPAPAPSLLDAS
jgi:hypothetical protein